MSSLVQQANNSASAVTFIQVTLPFVPVIGNVLFVKVVAGDGATVNPTISGVTGVNASFTSLASNSQNKVVAAIYAAQVVIGSRVVTVNLPSSMDVCVIVEEWFGLAIPIATDGSNNNQGVVSPATTGGVTTTNANDLIQALVGDNGSGTMGTVPSPWINLNKPTQRANARIEAAYQVTTAPGSFTATFNDTGSVGWASVVVAVKKAVLLRNQFDIAVGDINELIVESMPAEWPLNLWEILELRFTDETGWGSLNNVGPVQPETGNIAKLRALYNGSHGTIEKGLKGNVVQVVQGTGHTPFTIIDWRGNTGTYVLAPDSGLDIEEIHGAAPTALGQGYFRGTLRFVKIT